MPTVLTRHDTDAVPIRSRHRPRTHVWLPMQPLREAMLRHLSIAHLADLAGVCTRTAVRWLGEDALPDYAADRVSCRMGLHPALVWGPAWWDLAEGRS